ncbi:MAG: hypothetical protein HYZ20_15380 [Burkholderiales bacterium]|nr:hypothetical protein [Burkholderiales bacterium]
MNDNVENLVLEHLKAIRADLGDLRREVREVKSRLASLEGQVVQMHKSVAFIHEDLAGLNLRIDGLSDRVEKIERRLDLREAAWGPRPRGVRSEIESRASLGRRRRGLMSPARPNTAKSWHRDGWLAVRSKVQSRLHGRLRRRVARRPLCLITPAELPPARTDPPRR